MAFSPITTAADTISKLYGAAAQQRRADTPIKPPMATAPMLPQPTPAPVDPLQQKFNDYMLGKPMTPGRGKRRGQSVVRGGRYSGRTPDELYGVLAKEQNRGSGLSTGSLSQGSGIDWLKANRTSGATLAAKEGNVARRGDRYDTRAGYQPPTAPMKPTPMQPVSPVVAGVGNAVPPMAKPSPQAAVLNASPAFMNEAAPKPVKPLVPNQFTSQMSPVSARPAPATPKPTKPLIGNQFNPFQMSPKFAQGSGYNPLNAAFAPGGELSGGERKGYNPINAAFVPGGELNQKTTPRKAPSLPSGMGYNDSTTVVTPNEGRSATIRVKPMPNQFNPPQMSPKKKRLGLPEGQGYVDNSLFPR